MDETAISEMLEGVLGTLAEAPCGTAIKPVAVLVEDSYQEDVRKLLDDRICGLLLQDTLSSDQVALLAALLNGYGP